MYMYFAVRNISSFGDFKYDSYIFINMTLYYVDSDIMMM